MEFLPILVIAIQILFAVHVVRSGRPIFWIFVIVFVPLIGCAIYFFVAVLPDMTGSRAARAATDDLVRTVDPGRDLRRLRDAYETTDTIDNRRALADEYVALGKPKEAIGLYEGALVGVHKDDPVLLHGLARAQFAIGDYEAAIAVLKRMRTANPDHEMAAADLLLARALEGAGRTDEALDRYEVAVRHFPGPEAKTRYGSLLLRLGRRDEGKALLEEVVRGYERAARPFRHAQREWYEQARRALAG